MDIGQNLFEKLVRLLKGERIPASSLDHALIKEMDRAQVIQKHGKKDKLTYYVEDPQLFESYLRNNHFIYDLKEHIETLQKRKPRKVKARLPKTLEGFFATSFQVLKTVYNADLFVIAPPNGTAIFITEYKHFFPGSDTIIVGVESAQNFKDIQKQKHLFAGKKILFVFQPSRGMELQKWLKALPNKYLHFSNYDFVSLSDYYSEYRSELGSRCSLFIPTHLEKYVEKYGNSQLYYDQLQSKPSGEALTDKSIQQAMDLIEKHKKVLEQKYFINLIDQSGVL